MDLLTGEPCSLEDHRAWRSDIEFTVHQEEEEGVGEEGGWLDLLTDEGEEGGGCWRRRRRRRRRRSANRNPLLVRWTACSRRTACR